MLYSFVPGLLPSQLSCFWGYSVNSVYHLSSELLSSFHYWNIFVISIVAWRQESDKCLVQSSTEKLLCAIFPCEQAGKPKDIYSFLLMVSSNCSNGAVIGGWRIKETKYTSSKSTGFASCAAASTPRAGLSSLGHLLCFIQSTAGTISHPET